MIIINILFFFFSLVEVSFAVNSVNSVVSCAELSLSLDGDCKIISDKSIFYTAVAGDQYRFYYSWDTNYSSLSNLSKCEDGSSSFFIQDKASSTAFLHSICESEVVGLFGVYRYGCDQDASIDLGDCNCPNFYTATHYFEVCKIDSSASQFSQQTLSTTNDLISQSNSKFGVIASTNSAITNFLNDIDQTLLSMLSQDFGTFGVSDSVDFNSSSSSEEIPQFETKKINLSQIDPVLGSPRIVFCPDDISISIFGRVDFISYQPLCGFAVRIRPIVIYFAELSAAWLLLGAL